MVCQLSVECVANENSESESDKESDSSESEEESDAEVSSLDLDTCPPGCDQNLYDSTCLLRERRVTAEEQLAEERLNKDTMIKELDLLQKRAKVTEQATKTVEQELEAFQVCTISLLDYLYVSVLTFQKKMTKV